MGAHQATQRRRATLQAAVERAGLLLCILAAVGCGEPTDEAGSGSREGQFLVTVEMPVGGTVHSGAADVDGNRIRCGTNGGSCGPVLVPLTGSLTLRAVPDVGNGLVGWRGDCTESGPCVLEAASGATDKFVTAEFRAVDGVPADFDPDAVCSAASLEGEGSLAVAAGKDYCGIAWHLGQGRVGVLRLGLGANRGQDDFAEIQACDPLHWSCWFSPRIRLSAGATSFLLTTWTGVGGSYFWAAAQVTGPTVDWRTTDPSDVEGCVPGSWGSSAAAIGDDFYWVRSSSHTCRRWKDWELADEFDPGMGLLYNAAAAYHPSVATNGVNYAVAWDVSSSGEPFVGQPGPGTRVFDRATGKLTHFPGRFLPQLSFDGAQYAVTFQDGTSAPVPL